MLLEYKKSSDWKKYENIRNHINNIDIIDNVEAESIFSIGLPFNLGIYKLSKEKNNYLLCKNNLLEKMVNKILSTSSLNDHIVYDDLDGISCLLSLLTGGSSGRLSKEMLFMLPKEKAFFTNKRNDETNETYFEQRSKTAWGNVKPKAENTNVKFKTKEERENFYKSWNTKCLRWLFNSQRMDVHVHPQFLPYLNDYTHGWTDEMLYDYFNLTQDEINEIKNTVI